MTNRLLKTKRDHKQARAVMQKNTVAQTMTPNAGALAGATIGAAYTAVTFALSAPVGASHFAVSSGALPAGLSLNAKTGAVTGTPTGPAGSRSFSVQGADDFGNKVTNAYTINVTA